jgi:AraC-like DNA-binding protein
MFYREQPLPPETAHAALCVWSFALEPADPAFVEHKVPPDGTTNLLVALTPEGQAFRRLVGPSIAATHIPVAQGWRYVGLRLRPEAAEAVTGRAPGTLVGASDALAGCDAIIADLEACAREPDAPLRPDRIVAALAEVSTDPIVAAAVDALIANGGTGPIGRLAEASGLGARQFRRRFESATGLSPKQFASVQRVRRALILSLECPSWSEVAVDSGYADQAHLSRAVRSRFGISPRQIGGYINGIRHSFVGHVPFVQDRPDNPG